MKPITLTHERCGIYGLALSLYRSVDSVSKRLETPRVRLATEKASLRVLQHIATAGSCTTQRGRARWFSFARAALSSLAAVADAAWCTGELPPRARWIIRKRIDLLETAMAVSLIVGKG